MFGATWSKVPLNARFEFAQRTAQVERKNEKSAGLDIGGRRKRPRERE